MFRHPVLPLFDHYFFIAVLFWDVPCPITLSLSLRSHTPLDFLILGFLARFRLVRRGSVSCRSGLLLSLHSRFVFLPLLLRNLFVRWVIYIILLSFPLLSTPFFLRIFLPIHLSLYAAYTWARFYLSSFFILISLRKGLIRRRLGSFSSLLLLS